MSEERLDDIAASVRRISDTLTEERKQRREDHDLVIGRLSDLGERVRQGEAREVLRNNRSAELFQRLVKAEEMALAAQRAASEADARSREHMAAVISHIAKVEGRLTVQDTALVEVKSDLENIRDLNEGQTATLAGLVAADDEARLHRKWQRETAEAADTKRQARRKTIAWALGTLIGIGTLIGMVYAAVRAMRGL